MQAKAIPRSDGRVISNRQEGYAETFDSGCVKEPEQGDIWDYHLGPASPVSYDSRRTLRPRESPLLLFGQPLMYKSKLGLH